MTLMAAIGLALDLALLYHAELQLRIACESAAVAGAFELMDEDVLRGNHKGNCTDDAAAARRAAWHYAQGNVAVAHPVTLARNEGNQSQGDLVVGWVENPTNPASPFTPWNGRGPCNSLVVRAQRTSLRGNPVSMWFAQLFGLVEANVAAEARGTVDQRVYGFRPVGKGTVPVVPLTVRRSDWVEGAFAYPVAGTNDNYSVNHRTGAVRYGPDGIPEIKLRAKFVGGGPRPNSDPGNFGALLVRHGPINWPIVKQQIRNGLRRHDLVDLGGELALNSNGSLLVRCEDKIGAGIVTAIAGIKGVNRVWPLYVDNLRHGGTEVYKLAGFGAGCVVAVSRKANGQWIVVVQPGLLVSRTALVRKLLPHEQLNPWIAKLSLTD